MRKAKLSKYVAVVTAIGMIAVSPMAALADTVESVKIEGNETKTADGVKNTKAEDGVSMTDKGDTALSGTVTVNGNVSVSNSETAKDYFERNRPGAKWEDQSDETKKGYEDFMENAFQYAPSIGVDIDSKGGNASVDIGGNITVDATSNNSYSMTTGIWSNTESDIKVGGDVTATTNVGKAIGVNTGGDDTSIAINGGVEASSEQWAAKGVQIQGKTDLTVVGDVKASTEGQNSSSWAIGISAGSKTSEGEITIGGDVTASGIDAEGIYIVASNTEEAKGKELKITVGGDVTATSDSYGLGIQIADNDKKLNITVEGDITGSTNAIRVDKNTGDAKIVSGGTISSKDGAAIVVVKLTDDQKAPEVTAWKIESGAEQLVSAKVPDDSGKGGGLKEDTEYAKTVQSAINYIIKADATENGSTSSNGKIVLKGTSGTVTVGDKTYDTAHQDETITINVETAKGYKSTVQNNGAGTLTKNADGTYTLTIPAGGGVDLKAVLEKIEEQNKGNSTSNSGRHNSSSSSSSSSSSVSGSSAVIYAPGSGISGDTNWAYDNNGWKLKKPDGNYASSEWRQVNWNGTTNWYHFNNNGYADGGWFTDSDGQRYFLYNAHDGQFGYMFTGWKQIDGQWYFFNTANTATASLGSLFTNGTTPDGYQVNANGIWVH